MTEDEMLQEIVQEYSPREIVYADTNRHNFNEWNLQMYYETMGMDFEYSDEDDVEQH